MEMEELLPENDSFVEDTPLETRFIDDGDPSNINSFQTPILSKSSQLSREILRQELQKLFDYMHIEPDNLELQMDRFKVISERGNNILYFEKGGRWFNLTRKDNGEFKTREQINKIFTKNNLAKLGSIKRLEEITPTPKELEQIPLKDLSSKFEEIHKIVEEELPLRELKGLDQALQNIKGEFVNGTAKLSALDEHIVKERRKLTETDDEHQKKRIKERLKQLKDERELRIETQSQLKPKLQTQVARIRQTLDKIADGDRSLKERLKILWREQGLTLVSVLTAIGMTVSTLVLALQSTAAGGGGGGKNPHKVRDWVKRSFNALGRILGRVANWALKALPGVLGSLVSGLFSLLKSAVTVAAQHGYAVIGVVAATGSYLFYKEIK